MNTGLPSAGWWGSRAQPPRGTQTPGDSLFGVSPVRSLRPTERLKFPTQQRTRSRDREGPRMVSHCAQGPDPIRRWGHTQCEGRTLCTGPQPWGKSCPGLGQPGPGGSLSPAAGPQDDGPPSGVRPHLRCPRWRCCRSATALGRKHRPPC